MIPTFPLGVFRDIDRSAEIHPAPKELKQPAQPLVAPTPAPASQGAVARGELKDVALTLSGFGGQGVLFAGLLLAEGAVREGLEVSWIPSYGPEMRGGTAHCHLRLSRSPIASPWINRPSALIAFNQPSIEKFAHKLLPGGLLLVNSSLVTDVTDRKDILIVKVPAFEIAESLGNPKAANMVLVGAYLEITQALKTESIHAAFVENGIKPNMIKGNMEAIEAGRELVRGIRLNK